MRSCYSSGLKHTVSIGIRIAVSAALWTCTLTGQAQEVDADTKRNVEILQNYYQRVQDKMGSNTESPVPTHPADVLPSVPGASAPRLAKPDTTLAKSDTMMDERLLAAPISGDSRNLAAAYTHAGRDPFAVTPVMLENENSQLKKEIDFIPLQGDFKIPSMRLKGVITGAKENDALTALLEIDGLGTFVVREGDSVGLQGIGNGRDVILIESISRLSLVVRTGSYGGVSEKRFVVR